MSFTKILLVYLCQLKTEYVLGVDDNNLEYFQENTDYDLYDTEAENFSESDWDNFNFSDFYENYVNSNLSFWERETRRNEFIPFNSLTFGEGGAAVSRFKSKIKDKDKNRNRNKYEWWKKQKVQQKKKKHKNKPKFTSTTSTSTTTTATTTTTRSSTTTKPTFVVSTWFPTKSKTSTVNYFSRPLDYQKPVKTVWWSQKENEKEKSKEDVRKRLPTLSEVSNLFEEFYFFAQHYSWIYEEKKVKRIFMTILEKFATKNISIVDVKKVKNYLQKEIFVISNSVNEASINYDIFNRYNFIVTDLIKRKSNRSTVRPELEQKVTTSREMITIQPPPGVQATDNVQNSYQPPQIITTTTRKPLMWKPGKTPNSNKWKNEQHYYPQSVSWSRPKDTLDLSPMFGVKPDLNSIAQSISQLSHIITDVPGVGTHKWMPPKMIKTEPSIHSTDNTRPGGRIVKDLGLNGENLNIGHKRPPAEPEDRLMSPFLVTTISPFTNIDQSLSLSPFLVNQHGDTMELEDMKKLMDIFIQSDFRPLSGLKQETEKDMKQPPYNNQLQSTHLKRPPTQRPSYLSSSRFSTAATTTLSPIVTTYRPVPDYLSATENSGIADILAELIVDQIDGTDEADQKNDKGRQLLKLLKILISLDDVNNSDLKVPKPSTTKPFRPKTTTKYVPISLLNQPGPPYLQSNYLPPNSLITRPPRKQPQLPQSLFQTDFGQGSIEKPKRFTETSVNRNQNKGFINEMIKDLMSNVDTTSNEGDTNQYYPDKPYKYKTTRKPNKFIRRRRPLFNAKVSQPKPKEVDVVRRKPSKIEKSPFSRYPVKVPTNQISQNPNFQLPIDSLSSLRDIRRPEKLSGRNSLVDDGVKFLSFDEQLQEMLRELGNRIDTRQEAETMDEEEQHHDLVYVNVWENVNGDVKLTGQRPISRLEFEKMQRNQEFSELMLSNVV